MPFALDSNPNVSEVSEAINYLLANFGANISADPNTGQIIGPTGQVSGYLYKYMAVKYADSFDGSVNFSDSPTNRLYFGLRNNNNPAESNNPADYIWLEAAGGFGVTKSLWYVSTGGRQIQFEVSISAPDTGWLVDPGSSIDLDVVTSGNIPVIAESFVAYFSPAILQVPRSGTPLTPSFSAITPTLYAVDGGTVVAFVDAQTDSNVGFLNNTWRIGNSSTTGYGDISYTNVTVGSPTDGGDYAVWPNPTAMSSSPAYITVPIRYKNNLGVVAQAGVATIQLVFVDPGANGTNGTNGAPGANGAPGPVVDITGYTAFVQNAGGAFTPPNATLSALVSNITSPTYNWAITGATPTSSTASSVVLTPGSSSTGVSVTLTVNGSNLSGPLSKQVNLPVVYDGAAGQAGSNGVMSAFPTIYIWTSSSTPPTRPATTSTYTWATGAYTAPSGWATTAPSNTLEGYYLWSITIPLNTSATTATSTLDWTNTANPIRSIAYNGVDGINGINGTNGVNGTRTAILDVYQWSATPPTVFPSGSSTYTWATGQFTAPASLNGWSLTPPQPVLGQNLYIARQLYADTNTSATSSVVWSVATSTSIAAAGVDGQNGARTAILELYQWAASTPTVFPSGTSTYTWANGSFTAPSTPNSWSLTPGNATPGFTLYACSVSYSDTNTTATSTVTWTTSVAYVVGAAGSNGNNGADGTNGTRTAILEMYRWSELAPTTFPSGNSTYTWSTGQFTTPGVPNGWSIIPQAPVLGQTLWVCRVIYADNNSTATTSIVWNATTAYAVSASGINGTDGFDGANGSRTAVLELYQWATVIPTSFPSGNSTYTWANGSFTAPTTANGWQLTPGSSIPGGFLFACSVSYVDNLTTATSTVTWNTTTAYVIGAAGTNGANGLNGTRTAILDVYRWSVTAPTVFPIGSSTYTWATGQFTAPQTLNGWSLTPPLPVLGQTLWVARTIYADNNTTTTSTVNWTTSTSTPTSFAGNNGTRTAFLEVYKWANAVPTTFPSGTSTYEWANGSFTAPTTTNDWSLLPGASTPGYILYACSVAYADNLTTATSVVTWSTSTAYVVGAAGANGANGANGTNGTNGTNGAATYVITRVANDSSAPTNAEVSALLGRNPVAGDICTVSYNNFNNATVYRFAASWALFQTYITGSLIVQNTITSDKMVTGIMSADNTLTRGLTVRDNSGNIILAAGSPLSFTNITPASGWLNSNISISGGTLVGIGSGSGTYVQNNLISINANGTLSGAGGGAVTPAGINAINVNLSNAPAGILNSNISLGSLGAGGFAYLSQITSANASTYIAGAAIGTAQVGVLTAGNIGAGTIDASKIAANTITAGQIAANTITSTQIAAATISAGNMAANSITAANAAIANAAVNTLQIAGQAVTVPSGAYTSSSISVGTTYTTVQEISYTSTGATTAVFFSFKQSTFASLVQILRNGTAIFTPGQITNTPFCCMQFTDVPPSGAVTYSMQCYIPSGSVNISLRSMVVLELKR